MWMSKQKSKGGKTYPPSHQFLVRHSDWTITRNLVREVQSKQPNLNKISTQQRRVILRESQFPGCFFFEDSVGIISVITKTDIFPNRSFNSKHWRNLSIVLALSLNKKDKLQQIKMLKSETAPYLFVQKQLIRDLFAPEFRKHCQTFHFYNASRINYDKRRQYFYFSFTSRRCRSSVVGQLSIVCTDKDKRPSLRLHLNLKPTEVELFEF